MSMGRSGWGRWRLLGIGVLAVAGADLGLPAIAVAQERDDCRCVDREGVEIENCVCFRTPVVRERPFTFDFDGARLHVGEHRARIGVAVALRDVEGVGRGALLEDVREGSPAWEAGLRAGDLVVRVEDQRLDQALADRRLEEELDADDPLPVQRFLAVVRELEPGEDVEFEYLRDGEPRVTQVTPERGGAGLAVYRALEAARAPSAPRPPRAMAFTWGADSACFEGGAGVAVLARRGCVEGLRLTALNEQLADYFGVDEGVLVTEVLEGSSFDLQAGDVIRAIDGRAVEDPQDVRRILASYEADETVLLTVVRRGEVIEVRGTRG